MSAGEWHREVLVVCTGRRQHRPSKLLKVEFTPQRATMTRAVDPGRTEDGERFTWTGDRDGRLTGNLEMNCPHCGHQRVNGAQLSRAAWEYQRAGKDTLDVSLLT